MPRLLQKDIWLRFFALISIAWQNSKKELLKFSYKDISQIKSNGSTETEPIIGNKNEHEEEVPQNIAALLTQAKSFKQHDNFVINNLIMSLKKLDHES